MIERWAESESSPKLLWLHGPAGLGKTAIAHTAAKLFHDQHRLAGFFSADVPQTPKRFMPTIAYHLATWHADYQKYVLDVLRGPRKAEAFSGLGHQFDTLFKRPMSEINICSPPAHKPLVIVLDALENCLDTEDCRRPLVDYIVDIATLVPWLKVLVVGRRSDIVETRLLRVEIQTIDLGDPVLDVHHDIGVYAGLCRGRHDPLSWWTIRMVKDANGLLERICWSFDSMIRSVMKREGLLDGDIPIVRDVLAVMSCMASVQPFIEGIAFHFSTILHFLRAIRPDVSEDNLHRVIVFLSPIIDISDDSTLRMLFPSRVIWDFLSNRQRSGRLYADVESVKRGLPSYCLNTMRTSLQFNVCGFESAQLENWDIPDMEERINAGISDVIRYCSLYWIDLVAQSDDVESCKTSVTSFLCTRKALFWLEVLTLLDELDSGKAVLSRCAHQFKVG